VTTDETAERRGQTVPVREWWTLAVKRELKARNMSQRDLATQIGARDDDVSRCINRKVPTLLLLTSISDALAIPYPFILPETEPEALHLAMQRRLIRRDLQLSEIMAGVSETKRDDQTSGVEPEHGIRSPKRQRSRRVDARR
jgi:hypothetical protein